MQRCFWYRFFFLHVHVGPFGGHKMLAATRENLQRLAVWDGLSADV